MKKIYSLFAFFALTVAQTLSAQIVISQAYGGGGNNGAIYKNDFIELYNRGNNAVSLNGYTLQYASATGSFGQFIQALPNVVLQPGQFFLIQQKAGNGGTKDLPTPDYIPASTEEFAMAGASFKIALASDNTAVTSSTGANVIDFVGVGTANLYEGTGATLAASNENAVIRKDGGRQDTNDNAADFDVLPANPRNSTLSTKDNNIVGLSIYPNPATDVLHITTPLNAEKDVTVYDMLGKVVLKTKTQQTVNVTTLAPGVYLVKIVEQGKSSTQKVVIK